MLIFIFLKAFRWLFRCDVSGDGQLDLSELATFLSASVRFLIKIDFVVSEIIFYSKLTIVGKTDQTGNLDPKKLAAGVFGTLGVSVDKKLTKEQFVDG